MDINLPNGDTFGYLIEGGFLGPQLAMLDTPATNLFSPNVPYFSGNAHSGLNGLDSTAPYTVTWGGFTPQAGITDAPIFLTIARVSDGQPVISTTVAHSVTSFLIPGATLAPDTEFRATLVYSSRQTIVDAGFSIADSTASFDLITDLVFTTRPEASANFDGDSDVDGIDFLTWQQGYGMTNQTDNSNGDANFDGTVDGDDLAVWETQYGTTGLLTAPTVAVPEPSSALLALIGGMTLLRRWEKVSGMLCRKPMISRRSEVAPTPGTT
jgi:hypothetical protein